MKKSDIAIYISAVLTLILTTFVVFSTQNVTTYDEKKIDDILKKQDTVTNATPKGSADDSSPLFSTKINKTDNDDSNKDKKLLQDDSNTSTTTPKKKDVSTSDASPKMKKRSFADINNLDILSGSNTKKPAPKKKMARTITRKKVRPVMKRFSSSPVRSKRPAQKMSRTSRSSRTYTVRYGDTMWKIAERYGTSTLSVVRANSHLKNPNIIYPGMKIRLP